MFFLLKKLIKISLFSLFFVVLAILAVYFSLKDQLPNVDSLKNFRWQAPMQIYSADGKLISQFGEKRRIPLTLSEVPQHLKDALLATEDDRFYHHFGVDPIGMGRAVLGRLMGVNKGGGGTITMQVARNFFLTREQTVIRKVREIFLSFHIESLLTKDEIFELYLNKIPLGHRSFGFGAAAQVYYGKSLMELTLPQIAVLAGIPKAPSTMNPISSPRRAKNRRTTVLHRMLVSGYISKEEYQTAKVAPITAKYHGAEIELHAPYIAEMAHQKMLELYGKEQAYTSGYKVFLTAPSHMQAAAQHAVRKNSLAYDKRHGFRGAITNLQTEFPHLQLGFNSLESSVSKIEENIDSVPFDTPSPSLTTTQSAIEIETFVADYLTKIEHFSSLQPAVVIAVLENSIIVQMKSSGRAEIPWQGLSWAKEFINDLKQGPTPKAASEILKLGDLIYVEKIDEEYHLSQLPDVSSALISIDPDDGAIKAAVGGFSFKQSQFNRVTQAKRQPGSNIKPFIYSAALENGFTLASILNDAPINHWDKSNGIVWRPTNSPAIYNGPIRIKSALAQSKNVIAVRLLRKVGLDNTIKHLANFGFNSDELPRGESLALGSASLTPLEVVTGFASFANGGFLIEPYLISHIENSQGDVLYEANPKIACAKCELSESSFKNDKSEDIVPSVDELNEPNEFSILPKLPTLSMQPQDENNTTEVNQAPRVISAQNAFLITDALKSAIWEVETNPYWRGTGWRAKQLKRRDIAGKTGTTNESKDAWFSGYSRRLVTTSWIGFDDHRRNLGRTSIGSEAGAISAQPSWITFMREALKELPVEPFEQPDGITSVRIDKKTGKLTHKTDKTSKFEYFQLGTEPTEYIENTDKTFQSGSNNETREDDIF